MCDCWFNRDQSDRFFGVLNNVSLKEKKRLTSPNDDIAYRWTWPMGV